MSEPSVNLNIFDSVKAFAGGRDLDEVAAEAVDSITDRELLEIQSLHRPPATVQRVLEATIMLLDAQKSANPKPLREWADVKTRMVQHGLLSSIKSYDVEVLRSKPYLVMFILSEYFDGENALTFERTKYANHATASLFKWCVATLVKATKEVVFDDEPEDPKDSGDLNRKKRNWRVPLSAVLALRHMPEKASDETSTPQKSARQWRSPLTALLAFRGRRGEVSKQDSSEEDSPLREQLGPDDEPDEKSYPSSSSRGIMCCGCFFLPLVLVLLLWNERNVVCQTYSTMIAEQTAIVADCSDAASLEGKLAFFSCPITQKSLRPMTPLTSFNVPGLQESIKIAAVSAAQKIEMYQCIEVTDDNYPEDKFEKIHRPYSEDKSVSALEISQDDHEESMMEDASNAIKAIVRRGNRKRSGESNGDKLIPGSFEEDHKMGTEISAARAHTHTMAKAIWYKMAWADVWYNSSEFKATPENIQRAGCPGFVIDGHVYNNPTLPDRGDGNPIELGKQVVFASSIVAGAFTFHDDQYIRKFKADQQIELEQFSSLFKLNRSTDNFVDSINLNSVAPHSESPNYLSTCNSTRLGCIRISYNQSGTSYISALGLVGASGVMSPYPIQAPWGCAKESFERLWPEKLSFDDAISKLKEESKATAWIIRIVGLLLAVVAVCCVFNPIVVFADYLGDFLQGIPVLDELFDITLEGITAKLYCILSCSLGCSCGLLIIAVVWLGIQPLTGGPVLAAAIVLFVIASHATRIHYYTKGLAKSKQAKALQAAASMPQQPAADDDENTPQQPLADEDENIPQQPVVDEDETIPQQPAVDEDEKESS